MTNTTAKAIGTVIGNLINAVIDGYVAYLLGHQFHSFAIGMGSYIIFSSLSGIYTRLGTIKEKF